MELPRLGPDDRMAMVAFNGRRIDLLTAWSSSSWELEEVSRGAMSRPAREPLTEAELDGLEFTTSPSGHGVGFRRAASGKRLEEMLERVTLAATATLRSFARAPGRKVMLLLAGG